MAPPSAGRTAESNSNTSLVLPEARTADVVELDDALNDLTSMDEQQGRIVELRFCVGLATEKIALVLDISSFTFKRDWNAARAWLTRQMKGTRDDTGAVAKN